MHTRWAYLGSGPLGETNTPATWAGLCTLWRWTSCWPAALGRPRAFHVFGTLLNSAISHMLAVPVPSADTTRSHHEKIDTVQCCGTRWSGLRRSQPHSTVPDSEPTRSSRGVREPRDICQHTDQCTVLTYARCTGSGHLDRPATYYNKQAYLL